MKNEAITDAEMLADHDRYLATQRVLEIIEWVTPSVFLVNRKRDELAAAIVDLKFGQLNSERRWIPVSERLPTAPGHYYVTLADGRVGTSAFYVGAFDRGAIAWMPRPSAYEPDVAALAEGEGQESVTHCNAK